MRAPAPEPDGTSCLHCGRAPAAPIELRANTGLVVTARYTVLKGDFCKDCGLALFRDRQNATLLKGWWGVLAFFANFAAIAKNIVAWHRLNGLPPPHTAPPDTRPLDKGRPVVARPGILVPVLIFLAGSYVVGASSPPQPLDGECVNLGRDGIAVVDCTGLHDGRVLNMADAAARCAPGSDEAVKLRRPAPDVACVDLDR